MRKGQYISILTTICKIFFNFFVKFIFRLIDCCYICPVEILINIYHIIMKKKILIRILCLLAGTVGAIPTIIDLFGMGSAWQYMYNAAYLLIALPLLISLWATQTLDIIPFSEHSYDRK